MILSLDDGFKRRLRRGLRDGLTDGVMGVDYGIFREYNVAKVGGVLLKRRTEGIV
jgi:hypothetical protein